MWGGGDEEEVLHGAPNPHSPFSPSSPGLSLPSLNDGEGVLHGAHIPLPLCPALPLLPQHGAGLQCKLLPQVPPCPHLPAAKTRPPHITPVTKI